MKFLDKEKFTFFSFSCKIVIASRFLEHPVYPASWKSEELLDYNYVRNTQVRKGCTGPFAWWNYSGERENVAGSQTDL